MMKLRFRNNCSLAPIFLTDRHRTLAAALIATSLVMFTFPAQDVSAASFDCRKATTHVEKLICTNPELSKVDERLASVFQRALDSAADKESLRQVQWQWLAIRDACRDQLCIKTLYEKRLIQLQHFSAETAAARKKYPPYPDVWHRVIPSGHWTYFQTPKGDLFIEYEITSAAPNFQASGIFVFGGEGVRNSAEHRTSYPSVFTKPLFQLPRGPSRPEIVLNQVTQQAHPLCPQSLNYFFRVDYPDGSTKNQSLIYLLDKPREREVRPDCNSSERSYIETVVALSPIFFPLADETFLAIDEKSGIVVRFDPNLSTKSELMNKKIFWVDADLVNRGWKGEEANYQRMQDEMLKILKPVKK